MPLRVEALISGSAPPGVATSSERTRKTKSPLRLDNCSRIRASARSRFSAVSKSALNGENTSRPSSLRAVKSRLKRPEMRTSRSTRNSRLQALRSSSRSKAASVLRYSTAPGFMPSTRLPRMVRPSQTSPRNPRMSPRTGTEKPSPLCRTRPGRRGLTRSSIVCRSVIRTAETLPMRSPTERGVSIAAHFPRRPSR